MILREPKPSELPALTSLCQRSKAHWGYPRDMLKAFADELTVTPENLAEDAIMLAEDKRGQAIQIGAHEAVGPDADIKPCDVVIDFIGADVTLATAAANVARKGTVIVVGLAGGTTPFGLTVVAPEARFMSSFWGTRTEMDDLLALVRREPSIIRPVEALPLAHAQTAHDRLRRGQFTSRLVLLP